MRSGGAQGVHADAGRSDRFREHRREDACASGSARFRLQMLFDPYQMAAVAQRLARERMPIEEYPQTVPNLTAAHQQPVRPDLGAAVGAVSRRGMRLAISHAIITESARGWRLDKLKQQHKIDVVVALSMAALAAVRDGGKSRYDSSLRWVCDDDEIIAT